MKTVALVMACAWPMAAATFTRDIAPIVFRHCAACHRPGESGPFPLLTYADVSRRGADIARVVKRRYMPPWLPSPGLGLDGELRLSGEQIATIEKWVQEGAPEGDARDLPPLPAFPEGWQLGQPDLVLKMDQPYTLAAQGADVFRNFVLPVSIAEMRYVKAIEIRPGDKRLVHHANLLVDRRHAARRLDDADPGPGFAGMDIALESDFFDPDSHFLFWKPGTPPRVEAPDLGWRLTPGTDLVLNMHLQPSGKPETVQAQVGLYFSDRPATKYPILLQLERDGAIDIPPGRAGFTVTDSLTLPVAVDLLGVYPHAHYLGRSVDAWAVLPAGERKKLLEIRDWDMSWQAVYYYGQPVSLPKGTVVWMQWTYDNSSGNARNPNRPPIRVRAGNRASDEMAHVWLQVLPRGGQDQRLLLQRALMQARLRKYPADFTAHFNLGAVLLSEEKAASAAAHFRAAVQASPRSAAARTSLGAALQSMGREQEAIDEYRRAIACDPAYSDARYNLANLLARRRLFESAAAEYRAILERDREDREARKRLSTVLQADGDRLASAGQWTEAIRRYGEAIHYNPEDADAHNNLGSALAAAGRVAEALPHFEAAVRLDPQHEIARRNLDLARAKLQR